MAEPSERPPLVRYRSERLFRRIGFASPLSPTDAEVSAQTPAGARAGAGVIMP